MDIWCCFDDAPGPGGDLILEHWGGITFAITTALLAGVIAAVPRFADAITEAITLRYEAQIKPLKEVKEELRQDLKRLKGQLLVVIDDVDRLIPDEVLELFQLVKAHADFPNVVYLLLFDREVVERSLEGRLGIAGRGFIEKIVQVSFNIPNADQ